MILRWEGRVMEVEETLTRDRARGRVFPPGKAWRQEGAGPDGEPVLDVFTDASVARYQVAVAMVPLLNAALKPHGLVVEDVCGAGVQVNGWGDLSIHVTRIRS